MGVDAESLVQDMNGVQPGREESAPFPLSGYQGLGPIRLGGVPSNLKGNDSRQQNSMHLYGQPSAMPGFDMPGGDTNKATEGDSQVIGGATMSEVDRAGTIPSSRMSHPDHSKQNVSAGMAKPGEYTVPPGENITVPPALIQRVKTANNALLHSLPVPIDLSLLIPPHTEEESQWLSQANFKIQATANTVYLSATHIKDPDHPHADLQVLRMHYDAETGHVTSIVRDCDPVLFSCAVNQFPEDSVVDQIRKLMDVQPIPRWKASDLMRQLSDILHISSSGTRDIFQLILEEYSSIVDLIDTCYFPMEGKKQAGSMGGELRTGDEPSVMEDVRRIYDYKFAKVCTLLAYLQSSPQRGCRWDIYNLGHHNQDTDIAGKVSFLKGLRVLNEKEAEKLDDLVRESEQLQAVICKLGKLLRVADLDHNVTYMLLRDLSMIPPEWIDVLVRHGVHIVISTTHFTDLPFDEEERYRLQKSLSSTLTAYELNDDNVTEGYYSKWNNTIYVSSPYFSQGTILHEAGHALADVLDLDFDIICAKHHTRLFSKLDKYEQLSIIGRLEFLAISFELLILNPKEFDCRYDNEWRIAFEELLRSRIERDKEINPSPPR